MVFFVCESCNETLKRNQVEKHRCFHRGKGMTCVDCSVCFYGQDYIAHSTCVSEAEKYEKGLYKKKEAKKTPQDLWIEALNSAVENLHSAPENIQSYLTRLGTLGNVPRNKNKFVNFIKNSMKVYSDAIIESIWKYLESSAKKQQVVVESRREETSGINTTACDEEKRVGDEDKPLEERKKKKMEKDMEALVTKDEEDVFDDNVKEVKKKSKRSKKSRQHEEDDSVMSNAEEEDHETEKDKKEKKSKKKKRKLSE